MRSEGYRGNRSAYSGGNNESGDGCHNGLWISGRESIISPEGRSLTSNRLARRPLKKDLT